LLRAVGIKNIDVGVQSVAGWGTEQIEIVLALDNTGSMASRGKIAALKVAAKNMLDTLQSTARDPSAFKVGVVPFTTHVNVGASRKDAPWLYMEGVTPAAWLGCIADRDQPFDTTDARPRGGGARDPSNYPATSCANPPAIIQPLTGDFALLRSAIDAMNAAGNTNVTIGLNWAHAVLNPDGPLPGAKPYAKDAIKIVILLTDGDNTQNRWSDKGSEIDKRTAIACDEVKAKGVRLYTIRVIEGNAGLLKKCATSPSAFFDVKDASELDPVFKKLANEISAIRLTQ
jgi:von Willebrand factor type A domain